MDSKSDSSINMTPTNSQIQYEMSQPKKVLSSEVKNFSMALNNTSKKDESYFSQESSYLENIDKLYSQGESIKSQCSSELMSLNYHQDQSLQPNQDDNNHKYFEIEISQTSLPITEEHKGESTSPEYIIFKLKDISKIVKH